MNLRPVIRVRKLLQYNIRSCNVMPKYRNSSWGDDGQFPKNAPRPAGLRGKAIGLYYRDLAKQKKKQQHNLINLRIPPAILNDLIANVESLQSKHSRESSLTAKIDKHLYRACITESSQNTESSLSISKNIRNKETVCNTEINPDFEPINEDIVSEMKQSKIIKSEFNDNVDSTNNSLCATTDISNNLINVKVGSSPKRIKVENTLSNKPGTSKENLDYIQIEVLSEDDSLVKDKTRGISASTGYYKCGYQEIITETFDKKLHQSLVNGIDIIKNNTDINNQSNVFYKEYVENSKNTKHIKLMEFRKKLPTFQKSEAILEVIKNNQVVVISGETGCGKSTQVPQIILDDAISNMRGANTNILVTQPRRIAASSLAMRVAEERGEKLGKSVGYAVRLEKVDPRRRGHIMYCTTGVLLADLGVNQALTNYSHVILDEVHERNCDVDLSMCMLKKIIEKRKDLKLILMSATLDADKLQAYFGDSPLMHIEGLAYPVQDLYLEEILQHPDFHNYQFPKEMFQQSAGKKQWGKNKYRGSQPNNKAKDYYREIDCWLRRNRIRVRDSVRDLITDARIEEINVDLILQVVLHICKRREPGAVLVFLPGIAEISKLVRSMDESGHFPSSRFRVIPLHSKLPSLEQKQIFERPPSGVRKIIVATNIAETSITIDDVVHVVDCGKMKISGLSIDDNISTLKNEWIAKANLRQRRGRAGRCQEGFCYHIITSYRAEQLDENMLPEIQRTSLLEPILLVKRLMLGKAGDALAALPDPPAVSTVDCAVRHLQKLGALNASEQLTPLGWHLARLPVHPAAGKLLVLGALFGCLDRATSVAAAWGFHDPFQLVIGKEAEVDMAKRSFALGEPSDHIAISEAIIQWEKHERRFQRSFAYEYFLSNRTLEMLSDMKKQFGENLMHMGFLKSSDVKAKWENRNSDNLSLFKAIVAASLYPNIGTVRWVGLHSNRPHSRVSISVRTPEDDKVAMHPSSIMATKRGGGHRNESLCNSPGANWLVYWRKQRSTDLFLFDVTLVYTLPLVFFGEIKIENVSEKSKDVNIQLSSIQVQCTKKTAEVLLELRCLLDEVLASKINVPTNQMRHSDHFEEKVLRSVTELITAEDEQAEYMGDDYQSESEEN